MCIFHVIPLGLKVGLDSHCEDVFGQKARHRSGHHWRYLGPLDEIRFLKVKHQLEMGVEYPVQPRPKGGGLLGGIRGR